MALRSSGLQDHLQQGCHGSYILSGPGEEWGTLVILHYPPVGFARDRAHPATVASLPKLTLQGGALLLELEFLFPELTLPGLQLLEVMRRWGCVAA